MSLIILTKSPKFNFKEVVSGLKKTLKFLFKQTRGPQAVTQSLINGLSELKYDFKFNPSPLEIEDNDVIYINESIEALKWVIKLKKNGKLVKIIAGPTITILPDDGDQIMKSDEIDLILEPSNWVRDLWLHLSPELSNKIEVWPAGVQKYSIKQKNKDVVLVYQKNSPPKLFKSVISFLKEKEIDFKIIRYGRYKHNVYLDLLDRSKAMIYLSESESQGLALCEAWMKNVPTLVWNRGYWQFDKNTWKDEKISAPYLTNESGMFFKDYGHFVSLWFEFYKKIDFFSPRFYAENNFTDEQSAKLFLKLLEKT